MMKSAHKSASCVAFVAFFLHAPAGAQATQDVPEATSGAGLDDIIVTAEKRSSSVQRTPISIQAVDGATLKGAGPADIASITKTLPSVQFGQANGQSQVTIRGIGNDQVSPGFEGRTAIHIDGVYLPSLNGVLGSFFDLDRVEISEGPQGDLFGRNATAGAVDIVTKKPKVSDGLNGYFQLTAGTYNLIQAQGAIGAALTPTLAIRFAGDFIGRDGYGRNLATGAPVNDQKSHSLRASVSWRPASNWRIDLSADYFKEDDNNYATTFGGNYNETLSPAELTALVNPATLIIDGVPTQQFGTTPTGVLIGFPAPPQQNNDLDEDQDPRYRNTLYGFRAGIEYDLAQDLTLRSITGYRHNFHDQLLGTDFTPAKIVTNYIAEKVNSFSQEFQLIGTLGINRIVVGAYYFNAKTYTMTQVANGYPLTLAGQTLTPGTYYPSAIIGADLKTVSKALYFHDEIVFSDRFSLTLGGRYTKDTIDESDITAAPATQIGLTPVSSLPFPIPAIAYLEKRSVSYSNFSPRITASFKPDASTLIYATYSRGFKSGGFNPGADRPPIAPKILPPFKPEKIIDYEAGIKRDWFDRRLRTNVAAFYYDYKNLQVQQKDENAVVLINNAASARLYGVQASMQAVVSERLTLNASGALLHAKYKEFCNTDTIRALAPTGAECAAQGFAPGTQNLSGNRLNRAPSRVFTVSGDYTLPLAHGSLEAHLDATFSSKVFFSPFNVDTLSAPSSELYNATLRYDGESGFYGSLWVKNIGDRQVANQISNSALNTGANLAYRLTPPRTAGATIGYNF